MKSVPIIYQLTRDEPVFTDLSSSSSLIIHFKVYDQSTLTALEDTSRTIMIRRAVIRTPRQRASIWRIQQSCALRTIATRQTSGISQEAEEDLEEIFKDEQGTSGGQQQESNVPPEEVRKARIIEKLTNAVTRDKDIDDVE